MSAVDGKCVTIYDRLVLPDNPITDYNTRHSGARAGGASVPSTRPSARTGTAPEQQLSVRELTPHSLTSLCVRVCRDARPQASRRR